MTAAHILQDIDANPALFYSIFRITIIYIFAVLLLRFGNRRFLLQTPFDFVFYIIIGAVLSRAIIGQASLFSALYTSFILIILHWLFGLFAYHSRRFGRLFKGRSNVLLQNGEFNYKVMKENQVTEEDLREEMRRQLHTDDFKKVKEARLERTGIISFTWLNDRKI